NCGAVRRSDYPHASRKHRNRSLQFRGKQALRLQSRLRWLECELQGARADRLERFDDQLILPFRLVNTQAPPRAHLQAICGPKTYAVLAAAVTSRAQLTEFILEC